MGSSADKSSTLELVYVACSLPPKFILKLSSPLATVKPFLSSLTLACAFFSLVLFFVNRAASSSVNTPLSASASIKSCVESAYAVADVANNTANAIFFM